MQDDFNDIWEAMLKAAVLENTYNQMKDYPSIEEIDEIRLPIQYDMKMRKVIRNRQNKMKLTKMAKSVGKAASLLLVAVGIVFIILLQFDEVRASCKNVVMQIYERFVQYDFKSSGSDEEIIEVGFVPEGYELEKTESNEDGENLIYHNSSESTIRIFYFKSNRTIYLDNEHYELEELCLNNLYGRFFESKSKEFDNYITWNTEKGCFYIASTLDRDVLIKIAESIR